MRDNSKLKGKEFPCPICKNLLEIRFDEKHGKPYVVCDSCGVQMFIRRETGAKLLENKAKDTHGWPF